MTKKKSQANASNEAPKQEPHGDERDQRERPPKQEPAGALGGGHPRCGARKRGSSGYCGQAAGWGTSHPGIGHCKLHGGSTPNQKTKADLDRLDQSAKTLLGRMDLVPLDDPIGQLQKLAAEVVAFQEILGNKVEELRTWTYDDISDKEEVRAIILAYERAMDRTGKLLVDMARLNIEERLAKVTEAQSRQLIAIFVAVFDAREMDLSPEKKQIGRTIVAREIAKVRGSSAPELNGATE